MKTTSFSSSQVEVIDLFCGIGGLTHGFINQGLDVIAGIDNDKTCKYGYEINNKTNFIEKDILEVSPEEITGLYNNSSIKVLVGCAPCQPYSRLNKKSGKVRDKTPLEKFAELVDKTNPDIVSMENVRGLANEKKYPEFKLFLNILNKNNYFVDYKIVNASDYGVPQNRNRLVLLASKYGKISLLEPTHHESKITVRDVIGNLDPIKDGEVSKDDPLHRTRKLGKLNKARIKATPKDGGNSASWDEKLLPDCYKKDSGRTYRRSVYGRMSWDKPGPTMTTQCIGIGNGRFGHPEQDRAITLREAALLQTFPSTYKFFPDNQEMNIGNVAKYIGNAVPVRLGVIIAKSINNHLNQHVRNPIHI